MRGIALFLCFVSATAAAQQPVQPPAVPTAPIAPAAPVAPAAPESARVDTLPLFERPTPAQARYMDGLKTAGRGIAQLKEGVSRVDGAGRDSVRLRKAGYILAGFCGTARQFMASGRSRMVPTAYQDSTQIKARRLGAQIDTLIRLVPTCETNAVKHTGTTRDLLVAALMAYETVLRDFRAAIGLPNR